MVCRVGAIPEMKSKPTNVANVFMEDMKNDGALCAQINWAREPQSQRPFNKTEQMWTHTKIIDIKQETYELKIKTHHTSPRVVAKSC